MDQHQSVMARGVALMRQRKTCGKIVEWSKASDWKSFPSSANRQVRETAVLYTRKSEVISNSQPGQVAGPQPDLFPRRLAVFSKKANTPYSSFRSHTLWQPATRPAPCNCARNAWLRLFSIACSVYAWSGARIFTFCTSALGRSGSARMTAFLNARGSNGSETDLGARPRNPRGPIFFVPRRV